MLAFVFFFPAIFSISFTFILPEEPSFCFSVEFSKMGGKSQAFLHSIFYKMRFGKYLKWRGFVLDSFSSVMGRMNSFRCTKLNALDYFARNARKLIMFVILNQKQ